MADHEAVLRRPGLGAAAGAPAFDVVVVVLAAWMVAGVFVDGWAHINLASTRETFWTPWHAILYSGFAAEAAWIVAPVVRARAVTPRTLPRGYGLALAGLVVFGAGGAGDAVWHTLLGIEVGIDALLSPTHLLLLGGGILVLTAPLRAARERVVDAEPPLRQLLPAVAALTLTAALVGFFFAYAWGGYDLSPTVPFDEAALDELAGGHEAAEQAIAFGILSRIVTTVLLLAPLLHLGRHWRVPPGSASIVVGTVSLLPLALFSEVPVALVAAPLAAAVAADLLLWAWPVSPAAPRRLLVLAGATAFVLWTVHFAVLAATVGLRWPPELWGGAVGMATLAALGMAALAAPPQRTTVGAAAV